MTANQLRVKAGLSPAIFGDLKHGRQKDISRKSAQKLADVLGITVEQLYSDDEPENKKITKEQLKFALFNGDKDISDKMLEDVLNFAEFIKQNRDNK